MRLTTSDSAIKGGQLNNANMSLSESSSEDQGGWRYVAPVNELKVASNISGTQPEIPLSLGSVSPYIWSGSTSTNVHLESMSCAEIPLQICVFSPGIYDLSSYVLHWNLLPAAGQGNQDETRQKSGKCPGYTYHLTVLQST